MSFSKPCVALLLLSGAACTVTSGESPDGGATNGASGAGGSAGGTGANKSAGASGNMGSGGAPGAGGSAGAGGGSAGAGGSMDADGGTGTGGAGGSSMSDAAIPSDPCNGGTELTPNEDRDHATAYPLGAAVQACLQSLTDVDFYQFTIPTTPAQGGYVKVQVTDVGPDGNVSVHAFAAHDNGEFESNYNVTKGGSTFLYFAGKAGATFRLKVTTFGSVDKPTPYLLTAGFNPVNDANEPNDDNAHATPLTVGTAANGYFFAGLEDSTEPASAAWEDRFKVTLPAGDVTIALGNIASDMTGQVNLYNPLGSEIGSNSDATPGSAVVLKKTVAPADAGECVILVKPYVTFKTHGQGSTVPVFFTQAYSLLVTTP